MSISSCAMVSSLLVQDKAGRYVPATADQILTAARQVIDLKIQRGAAFTAPDVVKDYLGAKLAGFEHEVFAVLFLDNRHRLIEYNEMFRGTIDSASVYPREVVKEALRLNAAAVIFSHNHPSGHPEPSQADKTLTRKLKDAGKLLEIQVLDHLIVAGASFFLREVAPVEERHPHHRVEARGRTHGLDLLSIQRAAQRDRTLDAGKRIPISPAGLL